LTAFTLMASIAKGLKIGIAQRFTTVLDSEYVVDHLGRTKTEHTYGIPADKPASQSLPLSRGVEASILILSLVKGTLASRVKVTTILLHQPRAAWKGAGLQRTSRHHTSPCVGSVG